MASNVAWRERTPPAPGDAVGTWLVRTAAEMTAARRELYERAAEGGGATDGSSASPPGVRAIAFPDTVALLASELVTNALRHVGPPVVMTVTRGRQGWLLDVADTDPAVPPEPEHDRDPGFGGHGLPLVARLSEGTGWFVEDGRKHVWALLAA